MFQNHEVFNGDGYKFFDAGSLAPAAVLFDDNFESVESHQKYLIDEGFSLLLTSKVEVAKKAFEERQNNAVYLFDMHMKRIKTIKGRETMQGLAVGLALVGDLTSDGTKANIKHCATLTDHDTNPEALPSYEYMKSNGQFIERLRKDKFDDFKKFITIYRNDYNTTIKQNVMIQNINGIELAFSELSEKSNYTSEIAALMGYVGTDVDLWVSNRESIAENGNRDLRDRIESLAYIKHGLMLHFGSNDVDDQKIWMHDIKPELGGKSPWDCITSGDMDGINMVSSYVNRVIG